VSLTLRRARGSDAVDFFRWWNDRETRRFSGSGGAVTWEQHLTWMCENLANPFWYVGEIDGHPVGAVRIDRHDDRRCWVSIVLAPDERGKGYGTRILQLLREHVELSVLWARIHNMNDPSRRAFEKAGYVQDHVDGVWVIFAKTRD